MNRTRTTVASLLAAATLAAPLAAQPATTPAPAATPAKPTAPAAPPAQPAAPAGQPTAPVVKPAAPGTPGNPMPVQPVQPAQSLPNALKIEEVDFDFGMIPDTEPVSHSFKFSNISDRKVKITFAASCGCTVAGLEKDTFEPGESGAVTATFNPQGRTGEQHKTLTMTVIDPQGVFAQQLINFKATVKPLVALEPPKMFLSEVDHKAGQTTKLTITGRKEGFQVTKVESNSEFVTATLGQPTVTEKDGEKLTAYEVTLEVGKGAPLGNLNAQLTITTNDEKAKVPTYFLGADVVGDTKATPPQALLRVTNTSFPFSTQVRLDSRTGSTFNVKSVDIEGRPDMNLVADVEKGEDGKWYMITLSGKTPEQPGMVTGALVVATDAEGGETIRIPFTGAVRKPQGVPPTANILQPAPGVNITPVPGNAPITSTK